MKDFVSLVRSYSAWKLQEKGTGKLTRNELTNLREAFNKPQQPKVNKLDEALKRKVYEYKLWKLNKYGTDKLNEKEITQLKQSVLREAKQQPAQQPTNREWIQYVENYKRFKEAKEPGTKITYKELKLLKESFKSALQKGIHLKEADVGFDPSQAAPMAGDPNAMADPNAAAAGAVQPQDPLAMQGAIDQAINALTPFSQAGANPMGADPNAGIPPVDGTQPAQPPAPPLAEAVKQYRAWKLKEYGTSELTAIEKKSLQEKFGPKPKTKYDQIQERIAARQAKLQALQEGHGLDVKTTAELGDLGTAASTGVDRGGSEAGEELVKVPAANALANGYASGKASGETKPAKTWPTKAIGKEAGGALQGAGATQTKVKEEEEPTKKEEDKLEESTKTVTDVYVNRYLEPKLDFQKLREAMANGILG
jgi:hypothetical protein